jgi:plasmid stabilization system protein ParE
VPVRYYEGGRDHCDQAVEEAVDALFDFAEWRFHAPPNRCHPRARVVHDVRLYVYPDTYAIDLAYGYAHDRSSHWYHRVRSDRGEIFIDFVRRAAQELQQTLEPPVRKQPSTTRGTR